MSCRLEPAIWSCDTGQQIPCFDRCQLTITWMSNMEGCYKYIEGCLFQPISRSKLATILRNSLSSWQYLGSLRKPRRQRQRERRETKALMSRTIAVHVRYNSWYISLPSSAKQEREMTKFCVVWRTWTTTVNFLKIYFALLNGPRFSFVMVLTVKTHERKWRKIRS